MQLKIIEWFAGIGGAACAFREKGQILAAIDINQNAKQVYELNFPHRYLVRSIETISAQEVSDIGANTWWVSAPCQPFTRRGNQLDAQDPRTQPLLHLIQLLDEVPPDNFFLENVIGFRGSETHQKLMDQLNSSGFHSVEINRCPTELGIPNRRPRYYLLASRKHKLDESDFGGLENSAKPNRLADFLDCPADTAALDLSEQELDRYLDGLNFVSPESVTSNCFTSAYGRSMTKSGSYLQVPDQRCRRFSPLEISRFFGFQDQTDSFRFPDSLSDRQLWKLLGNSISVFVVRELLSRFATKYLGNPLKS